MTKNNITTLAICIASALVLFTTPPSFAASENTITTDKSVYSLDNDDEIIITLTLTDDVIASKDQHGYHLFYDNQLIHQYGIHVRDLVNGELSQTISIEEYAGNNRFYILSLPGVYTLKLNPGTTESVSTTFKIIDETPVSFLTSNKSIYDINDDYSVKFISTVTQEMKENMTHVSYVFELDGVELNVFFIPTQFGVEQRGTYPIETHLDGVGLYNVETYAINWQTRYNELINELIGSLQFEIVDRLAEPTPEVTPDAIYCEEESCVDSCESMSNCLVTWVPHTELTAEAILELENNIATWNDNIEELNENVHILRAEKRYAETSPLFLEISYLESLIETTQNFLCTNSSTIDCVE